MRLNLGDDPAVIFIADQCGIEQDAVVGKLHRLWSWMSEHSTDGSLTGVSLAFVDRHVRAPGFGAAMIKAGWLQEGLNGLIVPKFDAHMSESAKKRAVNRIHQQDKRERDVREMSDDSSDKNGTPSLSISRSLSLSKSIKKEEVAFPVPIDAPDCRAAWDDWLEHKASIKKPYKSIKAQTIKLNQLSELGPDRFIAAIRHSIGNNWQGIFEPEPSRNGNHKTKPTTWELNQQKLREAQRDG